MYDFEKFYRSRTGIVTRDILKSYIDEFIYDEDQIISGAGHAAPYISSETEPPNPNQADTIDRILSIHHLEFAENIKNELMQHWHLLKPNEGRVMVIVPNRHGLWARKDWTPFGHGIPFNLKQICHYLNESRFEIIQTREALFIPPTQNKRLLKCANACEKIGNFALPFAAGVHIIEAQKTLYAPTGLLKKETSKIGAIKLFPQPAP